MEGKKAREKDGKVGRGFSWMLGGGTGKELLTHYGSRNLGPAGKSPVVAESVVVMEGHVAAT